MHGDTLFAQIRVYCYISPNNFKSNRSIYNHRIVIGYVFCWALFEAFLRFQD